MQSITVRDLVNYLKHIDQDVPIVVDLGESYILARHISVIKVKPKSEDTPVCKLAADGSPALIIR